MYNSLEERKELAVAKDKKIRTYCIMKTFISIADDEFNRILNGIKLVLSKSKRLVRIMAKK